MDQQKNLKEPYQHFVVGVTVEQGHQPACWVLVGGTWASMCVPSTGLTTCRVIAGVEKYYLQRPGVRPLGRRSHGAWALWALVANQHSQGQCLVPRGRWRRKPVPRSYSPRNNDLISVCLLGTLLLPQLCVDSGLSGMRLYWAWKIWSKRANSRFPFRNVDTSSCSKDSVHVCACMH